MARIAKCQLTEVIPELPSILPFDAQVHTAEPGDLFMCALGFEPRCLTLPETLAAAGVKARRAAYLTYATNLDDNAANLPRLRASLSILSASVLPLEADSAEFPSKLRALLDAVVAESRNRRAHVTLDISVMANRALLRCMNVLLEYDVCLRIVYSEAAIYHPTRDEYEQNTAKWENPDELGLERGVSDVVPSIDHPGHALDQLPDCIILFPTFKAERSKAVISFVDPSLLARAGGKVIWLIGEPHLPEDRWRLDAMKRINDLGSEAIQHVVSTFDYRETLKVLETLHGELAERYRITLSPLGSKLQALGTALFCYMHPDVRVIFAMPKEYNATQYSEGCKAQWCIEFGPLQKLRSKLDLVGSLRIEE